MIYVKRRFAIATLLRVLCSLLLAIQGHATVAEAFQQSAANGQQQQTVLPSEPGMYVATASGFTKILGQIVEFKRSGSKAASGLTLGIKTQKENVQLLGPHAQTLVENQPVFYFIPAKQEADAGVNAGDLIMIRLEEKPERRQFEVGAQGLWRSSSGISITHQLQLFRDEVKPGVYKIAPATALDKGEYALYLARGEGMSPYVYDFSVQAAASHLKAEEVSDASQHKTDVPVLVTPSTSPAPSRNTGTNPPETLVMIYLTSDPDGAQINVDDSFVGKAPMTLKLKPGIHAVRMFMNDYQNWAQWITIEAGADVHIKASLTKSNE